jgi:hypothetical protein
MLNAYPGLVVFSQNGNDSNTVPDTVPCATAECAANKTQTDRIEQKIPQILLIALPHKDHFFECRKLHKFYGEIKLSNGKWIALSVDIWVTVCFFSQGGVPVD